MPTALGSYATAAALKVNLGISGTDDDTVLGNVCDRINAYIEKETRRILAPINSATYLYDGDGTGELFLPITADGTKIGGVRAISLLEVAPYTGGSYSTVASTNYFLRDKVLATGPYDTLCMSDKPSNGLGYFPRGYATVRVTATAGWAAIPDDITDIALTAAARAWHAIKTGQSDIVGTDDMGRPLVSRFFSARDYGTLMDYKITDVLVSG